ncbi:MAG: hypothetical protein A2W91_06240 [Bacteroidetes bacterium GWF2_38_335]|nr:MAG: hypothetical protein A2W91_06240 [Bacteroidetes bacterium GWF2_38_335]OFY79653.1 MAG: hypothetical protein A2281_09440 [Bacteroidetes bacterium RIFOXYA12_FULL_38_20]HBS89025.1 hypothetical protein [Bacteroidales bacterium]
MGKITDLLFKDIHVEDGLSACINCGTCTAICPAAGFYHYSPREIVDTVQSKNELKIIDLLKSEQIWYCGECMSCKTRCPRNNTPGMIIIALRSLSQELGYFTESEKGRQQLAVKRIIGEAILNKGYCVHIDQIETGLHPEQGPVWDWFKENVEQVHERLGTAYKKNTAGVMRNIAQEDLDELDKIFEVTGAHDRFRKIEEFSKQKARDLRIEFDKGIDEYFLHVYQSNCGKHY